MQRHPGLALILFGVIMLITAYGVFLARDGIFYAMAYLGLGFFGMLTLLAGLVIILLRRPT
jgi:hypothetical protein